VCCPDTTETPAVYQARNVSCCRKLCLFVSGR
jgi:hypothetical protein